MSKRPVILNFSGNDSAGLAGIAMDIRTQAALGIHSAAVITANTAQNNESVLSINPVIDRAFFDQIQAAVSLPIKAIKVGLIVNYHQINAIRNQFKNKGIPLVVDPVLRSSSGTDFVLDDDFIKVLIDNLFPLCTLLTPNIEEAERLSGITIHSVEDVVAASEQLLQRGVGAVLIKGGHLRLNGLAVAQDYFSDGKKSFWLSSKRVVNANMRGTGCALSSAIASAIALGYSLYDAVVIGKMAISQGIRNAYGLGNRETLNDNEALSGNEALSDNQALNDNQTLNDNQALSKHKATCSHEIGPINVTHFPNQQIDLPILSEHSVNKNNQYNASLDCNQPLLGLYPVVDRAEWIKQLAPAGISTIQLRVKDLHGTALEDEIKQAIDYAQHHDIRLFINDYWQLAIRYGAYGVHLGQEDLDSSDIHQIKSAGLRLGLSTHCHYEVARAHGYCPSYIACGPIYHTTTKDMPWVPQGVAGLSYWRQVLDYPLVAIGGINQQRFMTVAKTGVDSVAMITAITLAHDPVAIATQFVETFRKNKP